MTTECHYDAVIISEQYKREKSVMWQEENQKMERLHDEHEFPKNNAADARKNV